MHIDIKKWLLPLCIFLIFACSKKNITLQFKTIPPLPGEQHECFQAGIAITDITPPPGLPLAGYSALSSDSKGFRTRLKARAFYFKPINDKPVVIVTCDLLSGSRILHRSVSEKIAAKTDVSASGLVLYGTHTHTGPGNYFSSQFYNSNASNRSGFDYQLFQFLSTQISDAIIQAYTNQKPAKISTGLTAVLNTTRNRSLPAYLNNKTILSKKNIDIYSAVNPKLFMIRIDTLSEKRTYEPSGIISFFSIHPNISPKNLESLYSGDIIAYIEKDLENAIIERYHPDVHPVHAFINMTHGDNNPNLPENENFVSARKLGQDISKKAIDLYESLSQSMKQDIQIKFRSKDIDVLKQNTINAISLCSQPMIGCSVLGGAKGKGSLLQYIPPFAPGWPKKWFTSSCQGVKQRVLGPIHPLFFPKHHYPYDLMGQIIQIDNFIILPLPFEITCEAGKRMANDVLSICKNNNMTEIKHVLPTSCANGYWGYVVTIEEYQLQYYEGGHTLYGPNTRKFLSSLHIELLQELITTGSGGNIANVRRYPLKSKTFYPPIKKFTGKRKELKSPNLVIGKNEPYWSFQWEDLHPSEIDFHVPLIQIDCKKKNSDWRKFINNGIPVNDSGYDIAVILIRINPDSFAAKYEARWYNPETKPDRLYRFAVLQRKTMNTFYSSVFTGEQIVEK